MTQTSRINQNDSLMDTAMNGGRSSDKEKNAGWSVK